MSLQMKNVAAAPEAGAAAAAPKKSMMPIIIGVVALVCFGIGFGVMHFVMAKPAAPPKVDPNQYVKVGDTISLDEFMINLADPSNDHYLKTTITLGLKVGVKADDMKLVLPQIRDVIIMVLTSKRVADLKSPAGKIALKKALVSHINTALGTEDIVDVYFQDFAMQ